MTATFKWNKIVELYNKHYNDKEDIIQNTWENIFVEFFGYSRFIGEVERHRNIRIGSTERVITDIIIKEDNTDLFIVELKQHSDSHNSVMGLQLISYLKQLRLEVGVLICDKIYIFNYDYSKNDDEQKYAVIEFKKDNSDGIKFIEMFSKGLFEINVVEKFICSQIEFSQKVKMIKEELTYDLVVDLLRKHFTSKYGVKEFDKAIEGFNSINFLHSTYSISTPKSELSQTTNNLRVSIPTQQRKKASRLRFKMIDIPVGSTLVFTDDSSITAVTTDEKNHIQLSNGIISTLSDSVRLIRRNLGSASDSESYQGGLFWTYKGERLTDIRKRMGI